jgi:hypothetical protein
MVELWHRHFGRTRGASFELKVESHTKFYSLVAVHESLKKDLKEADNDKNELAWSKKLQDTSDMRGRY